MTTSTILALMRAAYRADRKNIYINPADIVFTIDVVTPVYDGSLVAFTPITRTSIRDGYLSVSTSATRVTIRAHGARDDSGRVINDGASLAPDSFKGVKEGAAVHDPSYTELNAIAAAWAQEPYDPGPHFSRDWVSRLTSANSPTWTRADVRQLLDSIFGDMMRKSGSMGLITSGYYSSVRYLGGVFSRVGRFLPIALACCMLLLSGCLDPPDIIRHIEQAPAPERVTD